MFSPNLLSSGLRESSLSIIKRFYPISGNEGSSPFESSKGDVISVCSICCLAGLGISEDKTKDSEISTLITCVKIDVAEEDVFALCREFQFVTSSSG